MYSIGELAKLSNSTVRTLRYYDEIRLLTPSHLSDGGHRYYDEIEVIRLHYIKVLKEMGFNLTNIQQMLEHQQLSHTEILSMQLKVLELEKERIEERTRSIRYLLQISEIEELSNWKDAFDHMPMNLNLNPLEVYEEVWSTYFSKDEVQVLKQLPIIGDNNEIIEDLAELINNIKENIEIDFTSPVAQQLAERWLCLGKNFFNGDSTLAQKFWYKQKEVKGGIGMYPFEPTVVDFIEKAIAHYFKVNNSKY